MAPPPSLKIRDAPYRTELARAPGWSYCVKGLDALYFDHPALDDDDLTLYVSFGFMNDRPRVIGTYLEPAIEYHRPHYRAPVDIFRIVRDAYAEMTSEGPFHEVAFRYRRREGWAIAHFYETIEQRWNVWRERRARLDELRLAWFERGARSGGFERVETHRLEILVEPEYGGHELVPLLVGWTRREVWMMTSGFTNPPNPRSDQRAAEDVCDVELVLRCSRASLEKADSLTASPEFQAMTLMAEAFYWEYVDIGDPADIDLTEPTRSRTLGAHSGRARSLVPGTEFLLTAAQGNPVDLEEGQRLVPAFVTVESALGLKLSPRGSATLHRWTGSLGRAPRRFATPDDLELIPSLRRELAKGQGITSRPLIDRMESFACLELYCGRTLPADIAPHLRRVYLLELGPSNWRGHVRKCEEWGDHDSERHGRRCPSDVSLERLSAYAGLRTVDLRQSDVDSLDWLASVPWIETLLLSGTGIEDFSGLFVARDLVYLDLSQTAFGDLAPIIELRKLEKLSLMRNPLTDIAALASMTQLRELILRDMPPLDLGPIASLRGLDRLSVEGQLLRNLSFLERCPKLRWLSLAGCDVEDLSTLPFLPELESLNLRGASRLRDLSVLRGFPTLSIVEATGTAVRDWDPVRHVPKVIGRP